MVTDARSPGSSILLVEDDLDLAAYYRTALQQGGYAVQCVHSGEAALEAIRQSSPELLLLDLNLAGDLDGFDVLYTLQARMLRVPALVLSARGNPSDIVRGLELGAFNYVTKPVMARVLLARVRSCLRLVRTPADGKRNVALVRFGDLTIDLRNAASAVAACGDMRAILPAKETRVLRRLLETPCAAVSLRDLFIAGWYSKAGEFGLYEVDVLKSTVYRLRKRIAALGYEDTLIHNVRNHGYFVEAPDVGTGGGA